MSEVGLELENVSSESVRERKKYVVHKSGITSEKVAPQALSKIRKRVLNKTIKESRKSLKNKLENADRAEKDRDISTEPQVSGHGSKHLGL